MERKKTLIIAALSDMAVNALQCLASGDSITCTVCAFFNQVPTIATIEGFLNARRLIVSDPPLAQTSLCSKVLSINGPRE
jgi:hypothetical protein